MLRLVCCASQDRQKLLAVIEASFGTFDPFNRIVRGIFAEHEWSSRAEVAVVEEQHAIADSLELADVSLASKSSATLGADRVTSSASSAAMAVVAVELQPEALIQSDKAKPDEDQREATLHVGDRPVVSSRDGKHTRQTRRTVPLRMRSARGRTPTHST